MEYLTMKNSNLKVSRFCMGGCPMGGYGWGNVQENELLDAIHAALDNGVNFFDTADTYGLGQSEITLAKGLENYRQEVVIQSKFGVRVGGGKTVYDNSPAYIEKALNESLKRLNTDYIDIYTIHYRDSATPIGDVVDTLLRLRDSGKIRYFGLSNITEETMQELLPYKGLFVNCQNEYSLACRRYETDFEALQSILNVTPLTWGSLGQGILTGKYNQSSSFGKDDRRSQELYVNFHGEKLEQNLRIVDVLREIAASHNKSVAACAIRYILDKMSESVVMVGIKRREQLLSGIEAMDWMLTEDDMKSLESISNG